jgi:hypothetical protein
MMKTLQRIPDINNMDTGSLYCWRQIFIIEVSTRKSEVFSPTSVYYLVFILLRQIRDIGK